MTNEVKPMKITTVTMKKQNMRQIIGNSEEYFW